MGVWNVLISSNDNLPSYQTVEITEGQNTQHNYQVYCDDFMVSPENIEIILEPNATTTETLTISNGTGEQVSWSAELDVLTGENSDDFLDLQFQYPLSGPAGQSGIECDGVNFYITNKFTGIISKYGLDGSFIENLSISFFGEDLAFDGTYFYGGVNSTMILEMDFYNQVIISIFNGPSVSAIAYNHDENFFYGYSWGENLVAFDHSGALLANAPVGPNTTYVSLAYDNASEGGPYLWGYGIVGTDINTLVQHSAADLTETGFSVSLGSIISDPLTNGAGGLFSHPDILAGTWTLGGIITDEWIWGLELSGDSEAWISIDPTSGTLDPGETEEMIVSFDATNVLPGIFEAEIEFTTTPDVGSPLVEVTMEIEGPLLPSNIVGTVSCTDISLTWDFPPTYVTPDSFGVYRNDVLITYVEGQFYTDLFLFPGESYQYSVSVVFGIDESWPVPGDNILVPLPGGLEPTNFYGWNVNQNIFCFSWDNNACLEPDEYHIYKDGQLVAVVYEPEYCDTVTGAPGTTVEYYVTAVFYFGESGPSNSFNILLPPVNVEENQVTELNIFPNPATNEVQIKSNFRILSIKVYDNSGNLVNEVKLDNKNCCLDISGFAEGLYILSIISERNKFSKRIIVK